MARCSDQNLYYALHLAQRYVMLIFKYFMSVVGPILHATALLLIFGISLVYFLFIFPIVTKGSAIKYTLHLITSTFLVINIFFNLISCAFTPPGSPPSVKDAGKILGLEENPTNLNQPVSYSLRKKCLLAPGVYYKYCKTCKAVKPPRAHHCSVLGRCVFEMDHYCPWMNNTVGLFNYRYFFFFLVYLFVACIYVMVVIGSGVITAKGKKERLQYDVEGLPIEILSLCFVVALGACISVGLLLAWHMYLVSTNQTTIEFYINIENKMDAKSNKTVYENPFDQGYRLNFARLLGNSPWYYNLIPHLNSPVNPLYPLRVMPGVLTDGSMNV